MTIGTISIRTVKDLLVDAVRLDREMHEHIGPPRLRAQQIPYEHDFADRAGWGKAIGDRKCQLAADDADPYGPKGQFSREFWEQFDRDPTPAEMSRAQIVHGWIMLVDDEKERRALIGWLHSKVGGKAFRRWCKQIEGISQTTGLKRKNRALEKIFLSVRGSDRLHTFSALPEGLLSGQDLGDVLATIATGANDIEGIDRWAAADAIASIEIRYESDRTGDRSVEVSASEFTWAAKRNARRRQREAAKRKQAQNG
ncbi:hypothetical protein [Aquamicrobium defluvii]|uniref:Uncharacterized protein n=1 Tax=Aquamicrobium defluvii TaxID=69279 RepID=A0A4R6YEQ4_9HYPH|nr:hypothetical protein [Aquamicrobium defluvii]TDR34679.1 hypothetical protein DES43_113110 [Aquamicrobium defluvii]